MIWTYWKNKDNEIISRGVPSDRVLINSAHLLDVQLQGYTELKEIIQITQEIVDKLIS